MSTISKRHTLIVALKTLIRSIWPKVFSISRLSIYGYEIKRENGLISIDSQKDNSENLALYPISINRFTLIGKFSCGST